MTRQIRNFLNVSCFPNIRGDLQGMSGPQSRIQCEGQCLHFGVVLPQWPVQRGGGARLGGKPRPKCTSCGGGGGGTLFQWTEILAEGPGTEDWLDREPAPLPFSGRVSREGLSDFSGL